MKLAEKLRTGKYRLRPLPKSAPPESEEARQKRRLAQSKSDFRTLVDKEMRANRDMPMFKHDFLDVPVSSYDFKEIFSSYQMGQYKYQPMVYTLEQKSWFYKFLVWLIQEGFVVHQIVTHSSSDPDEDDSYSFRVFW